MSFISHKFFEAIYTYLYKIDYQQKNMSLDEEIINLLSYMLPHLHQRLTINEI